MEYWLLDNRTGNAPIYPTKLNLSERDGYMVFHFVAEHSDCYAPYTGYNENHYEGDACEVFLEVAPNRYYEIELSPKNGVFLAKIHYLGKNGDGTPILSTEFVNQADCFVKTRVEKIPGGYIAEIAVEKRPLTAEGNELRFNAFRIETDGGERDKHLFALSPTRLSRFHVPAAFIPLPAKEWL